VCHLRVRSGRWSDGRRNAVPMHGHGRVERTGAEDEVPRGEIEDGLLLIELVERARGQPRQWQRRQFPHDAILGRTRFHVADACHPGL